MKAATSLAEAQKIAASASADAEKIRALAAAQRYEVDAAGKRQLNEAENLLSDAARAGAAARQAARPLEGIVRESVKPMEKIDGIKILHVDGLDGGGGDGSRNVTDEVIDSALRYRVQAPMIDNLMKEIGIEGGSLGRMTDVLRDAKDIASLTARQDGKAKPARRPSERDDDDDDERLSVSGARMTKVYVSSVIDAPAAEVWRVVRDFNGLPDWTPFVAESRIEQNAARRPGRLHPQFPLQDGGRIRERLLALSDYDLSMHLRDPGKPDGGRELCRHAVADAGHRRQPHLCRMEAEFDCRARARDRRSSSRSAPASSRPASSALKTALRALSWLDMVEVRAEHRHRRAGRRRLARAARLQRP